ncbi:hypothetical protein JCM30471_18380 [Desulfuromonas carbonis]|uniref:MASE3 domain-containing protein n=1 Tax=Desulfuromonas sp. DDH964 TaxID=1823759 RepID=UPI00078EE2DF|nr:MASE3 domain-containing protein [Desulfuromonas sp. DDH964]AMV73423.1 sensor histidine kinase response regulator, PAS, PAS and PAS domain-containing [Desulfuromonas sp. DDH964]
MNAATEELAIAGSGLRLEAAPLLIALAASAGLYLTSRFNYLLFHSLAELFSILVAFGTFTIAWHTRRFLTNGYLLLIGIAYLFIGAIDLVHTLAYQGMGVFSGGDPNLPTQLWIAARYLQSASLVAAAFFIGRRLPQRQVLAVYALLTALLFWALSRPGLFPDCFVVGRGLTPFKIGSEYLISLLLAGGLVLLWRRRQEFTRDVFQLLAGSILLTIGAELAFTFYVSVYGLSNLVGHIFKIASFYLVYRAIIQTGLVRPFDLIFRSLKQSEAALAAANAELELRVAERTRELTRAEAKYRTIFDQAIEGILQTTREGRFLAANPALATMLGYGSPEELIREIEDIGGQLYFDPADRRRLLASLDAAGVVRGFETRFRRRDGAPITVSLNLRLARNGVKDPYFEGMVTDITARKEAEAERAFLAAIVESSHDAIIGKTLAGTIVSWNRGAENLYGYTADEVLGRSVSLLAPPDAADEMPAILARVERGERIENVETVRIAKDGRRLDVALTVSPIRNAAGAIAGASAIAKDITDRKNLENQLRHAQKLEAVGTLTGGIAHDFNNILTAVIGFASLLERHLETDHPLHGHAVQILAAAERGAVLTRSLLTFSRKGPIDMRPVDLNGIIRGLEKMLRRLIRVEIAFQFDLTQEQLTIRADAGQIEQVLLNLTTNARDAMPDGGTLSVTTASIHLDADFTRLHGFGSPGRYALLTVADTGAGMEETVRQHIFEPFFTTKEVGKGTGLGLAVSYGIIKQHQGYINCYSEAGRGTIFRLYFPLLDPATEAPAALPDAAPPRGQETVLVMDDEAVMRQLLTIILEESGYTVLAAADGVAAIDLCRQHGARIGLCLLDMVLPKQNGWETFQAIRRLQPEMKALFMSGYPPEGTRQAELAAAGAGFIAKPIAPKDLLLKVRQALDRPLPDRLER